MRSPLRRHWMDPTTCLYLTVINPWPFNPEPLLQVLGSVLWDAQCFTQLQESPPVGQTRFNPMTTQPSRFTAQWDESPLAFLDVCNDLKALLQTDDYKQKVTQTLGNLMGDMHAQTHGFKLEPFDPVAHPSAHSSFSRSLFQTHTHTHTHKLPNFC